jgi:hypothetical protein
MRLILTNGDAAVTRLQRAGLAGDFLPWRDVLHDGPVREERGLEDLSERRAAFLAEEFGLDYGELASRFVERDERVRDHYSYPRVELWFEHDLYDQLQLAQVLDFFAAEGRIEGLYLMQADNYLGEMEPEALRRISAAGAPITPDQLALGHEVWGAFTSSSPFDLIGLLSKDTTALPFIRPAIERLLSEFPDPVRGLSLTEEQTLRVLADFGSAPASELFNRVNATERARFMGDASFFRRLDRMAFAPEPLIDGLPGPFRLEGDGLLPIYGQAMVGLTTRGREVLSGYADHTLVNSPDRWIGGVHLPPAAFVRYDRKHGSMIAPP